MADEQWLFPYDLTLTVRMHDGDAYLAIHVAAAAQDEPPCSGRADLWDECERRLMDRTED